MSKGPLKREFLDISPTTYFGSVNSKIDQLWGSFFLWKCSKLNVNLENVIKNCENIFRFCHNCIWKCCNKLHLLRKEYLSMAVNGLTNCGKIWHISQRDFLNPNCLHRDQWIWSRCYRSDFNSVSTRLQCDLSKGPLKGDFLDIYLTTFFGVRKIKNTSVMRIIFFWKSSQRSITMVKVLSFRFQQCFGPFTMWLLEGSSERGLFRHLSNHVFENPSVKKYIRSSFLWKCSKIDSKFRKCLKKLQKSFSFLR